MTCTKTSLANADLGRRHRRVGGRAAGLLAALLLAAGGVHAGVPAPSGWTLQFSDDFDGAAGTRPDPGRWHVDTGRGYPDGPADWGTHEIQTYTADPANLRLDGHGHLQITPLRDGEGAWTSARIETVRADFRPPAGGALRVEARLQLPDVEGDAALGYWPAFWALGADFRRDGDWPRSGEFDIMENVNGLDAVWGTLHCGIAPLGPCAEPNGLGQHRACPGTPCGKGMHTYRFEWDAGATPQALRWYVDGQLYGVVTQDRLPPATWREITGHGGYFLLLDVAMGGDFAYAVAGGMDTPLPKTEPGHPLRVDYVAVWTRQGTAGAGRVGRLSVRQAAPAGTR